MLNTLIASGAGPHKSRSGLLMSVALHTTLIAAAIALTGRAVMAPTDRVEEQHLVYTDAPPPPPPPKVDPAPQKVHVAPPAAPKVQRAVPVQYKAPQPKAAPAVKAPVLVAPTKVNVTLPPVNLAAAPTVSDVVAPKVAEPDFSSSSKSELGASSSKGGSGSSGGLSSGTSQSNGSAFTEDLVEKAVQPLGGASPRYPDAMRSAGIEGAVAMRFIVGANGRVEPGSIETIDSPNPAFTQAVRSALLSMRFRPAEVGGHAVRQLVEQSFTFKLDK
jgi:periplasmic protein TonB